MGPEASTRRSQAVHALWALCFLDLACTLVCASLNQPTSFRVLPGWTSGIAEFNKQDKDSRMKQSISLLKWHNCTRLETEPKAESTMH